VSYSDYRMNLIWASHGDQLRADLQRNIGGLTQFNQRLNDSGRKLGAWGQQMKAIGTTIRYALAGAAVYGVASAVTNLGEFEQALGNIDSLAARVDQNGNLRGLGGQLDQVGDFALETSSKFGVAVTDIEQYMQRFYSSFDAPAGARGIAQMRGFTNEIAQLQIALGGEVGDPAQLASGIAGLIHAMGGGALRDIPGSTRRISNIIAETTRISPVLTGTDITRDIGRLGAGLNVSRMTPEQVFAIYGTASQAGGSPAVIGRGISQMISAGLVPGHLQKRQIAAFQQAGLPTDANSLRNLGGWEVLMRMMHAVQQGPIRVRNPQALRDEGLDDQEAIQQSGVQGINMNLAANLFSRQESFRQFINLLAVGGPRALDNFIGSIKDGEKQNRSAQRAEIANQRRFFQRLQETQRNIGIEFLRGFAPVFSGYARVLGGVGSTAMRIGPTGLVAGAGGVVAASVASRLLFNTGLTGLAGRGVGRIPGVGPLLGRLGLGRLASRSSELAAASLIGAGPNVLQSSGIQGAGSRANPFWVVIDPLSWFMPGAPSDRTAGPGGGGGGGGGHRPPWIIPPFIRGAGARLGPSAAQLGRFAPELAALPDIASIATGHSPFHDPSGNMAHYPALIRRFFRLDRSNRLVPRPGTPRSVINALDASRGSGRILGFLPGGNRDPNINKAEGLIENAIRQQRFADRQRSGVGAGAGAVGAVVGEADLSLTIGLTAEGKRLLKVDDDKIHVPVKLWPVQTTGGAKPSSKGKAKVPRGSAGGR
jgi:hypothetical protein